MADKIELEVVTPERLVLREKVDEVVVPGMSGEVGILPDHTPLISQLQSGVLSYRKGSEKKLLHVGGGFVEVLPDRVSVLADVAEMPEEIDYQRAQEARVRAEKQLATSSQGAAGASDVDVALMKEKLQRAITRMELSKK